MTARCTIGVFRPGAAASGCWQVGGNAFHILVLPLFGGALASGDADTTFLALAGFTLFTAMLNARPAVPSEAVETT